MIDWIEAEDERGMGSWECWVTYSQWGMFMVAVTPRYKLFYDPDSLLSWARVTS